MSFLGHSACKRRPDLGGGSGQCAHMDRPDAGFLGSVPLNAYSEGFVRVRVYGYQDKRPRLFKTHWIKVLTP